MSSLREFQRDLLYLIAGEQRPAARAIKRAAECYYDRAVGYERLYPALDLLVEKELLSADDGQTVRYVLTDRGWDVIREHHA